MASPAWRNNPSRSGRRSSLAGRKAANGPNGMDAADLVAITRAVVVRPRSAAVLAASAASRLLPTPAAPASTNAHGPGPVTPDTILSSSSPRPTSGNSPTTGPFRVTSPGPPVPPRATAGRFADYRVMAHYGHSRVRLSHPLSAAEP